MAKLHNEILLADRVNELEEDRFELIQRNSELNMQCRVYIDRIHEYEKLVEELKKEQKELLEENVNLLVKMRNLLKEVVE